ncbi:MAG: hypothetical protein AAFQ21_15370 [Pseudomonadota bacterium]
MLWAGRELLEPHGAQFPAQRGATDRDVEFLPNPLDQINQSPPDHTVEIGFGASFHGSSKLRALITRQDRLLARSFSRPQRLWPTLVEAQHPIADHLKTNAASSRSIAARATI